MKVLLCSPYKNGPDIQRGGINQWAQSILSYAESSNEDIKIIPVSFDRHITRIHSKNVYQRFIFGVREQLSPFFETIKIMNTVSPDIVHICSCAGMGCLRDYLIIKRARRKHVKSVLHLHFGRLPELADKKNWEWKLLNAVLKECDVITPMNKPTENTLRSMSFENVKYLPNPLNNDIVEQIFALDGKIQRKQNQLLYVGHVYKTKGVIELIEGCSTIDGVYLRIIGKYREEIKKELLTIATQNGRTNWIDFVGEVPHNEVLKEFMKADMFVFPSYTEGFPNVILEAMACGCPIIASNVGAIPEMLDVDGIPCGMCIKPRSSIEVHDAIVSLLDDSNKKRLFAERAKQRVNSLYAMPVVWRRLVDIWKSTL